MEPYIHFCGCMSGSFDLTQCFKFYPCCSMCEYCFFVLPDSIPLYRHTTFYLSVHHLIDIWTDSTSWLVWIVLLWTCVYKHLCGHVFSFFLSQYLGVEWLGHIVNLCLTFGKLPNCFPKCLQNFGVHQPWMQIAVSPPAQRPFCILQPSWWGWCGTAAVPMRVGCRELRFSGCHGIM